MEVYAVQQGAGYFIQIFFNDTCSAHTFFFRMIVVAAGTPVRCIFVNLTLKCKRPINPAYPHKLETLGDHLRKIRLDRGLSQVEVARQLKVTTETVTGWELNRHEPKTTLVKRIYGFLGYCPCALGSNSIGDRLRQARLCLGHTQKQAASKINCDCSNIRLIEKGLREPQMTTRRKLDEYIRKAFETPSNELNVNT